MTHWTYFKAASPAQLTDQFLRFAVVGAAGTAVQYVVLWAGTSILDASAVLASAMGYALGSALTYVCNYLFTFRSHKSHAAAAPRYFAVLSIGWCLNTASMAVLVHHWRAHVWIAQVLTTAVVLIWNFSGNRWWTFRPRRGDTTR